MTLARSRTHALVRTEDKLPGPTISKVAEQQRLSELAIQRLNDRQDNLDKLFVENQRRIDGSFETIAGRLDNISTTLNLVVTAQSSNAAVAAAAAANLANNRPKWWHKLIGGAGLALVGWMASTIWSMETAKVDALQARPVPAAVVTVNPAMAPSPAALTAPPVVAPGLNPSP
jgi:hypothetical protein